MSLEMAHGADIEAVITPHVAAWSPESMNRMISLYLENLDRYFTASRY